MEHKDHIRNFVIIAHIDHGKSTLADRLLEYTGTVEKRNMKPQLLDQMDLERERGITIKMQPVRMVYHPEILNPKSEILNKFQSTNFKNSKSLEFRDSNLELANSEYVLNLIDTPGHIDFSYEVSRSLAAVEGAVVLVDASQGVQAQTVANARMAQMQGLAIVPVVNKIDLPKARIEESSQEIASLIGCAPEDVLLVSGKTGEGVSVLLEEIVRRIPPPRAAQDTFRALIFDSLFERHRGVIAFIRVCDGIVRKGDTVRLYQEGASFEVKEVGVCVPALSPREYLGAGEIGYVVTGMKEPSHVRIGDTLFPDNVDRAHMQPLAGYCEPRPVIWARLYPEEEKDFEALRDALSQLKLSDPAFTYEPESSPLLGRSFACGFLGMLHLEIITERIQREFHLSVITTNPSIAYEVTLQDGSVSRISSPVRFPVEERVLMVREPWVTFEIIVPERYLGGVLLLIDEYEGHTSRTELFGGAAAASTDTRLHVAGEMPLRELVSDFFDALKSKTAGYASLSYESSGLRDAAVERIDILVAGEPVPALARIVSREKAETIARGLVASLKNALPRQLFMVKIQAVLRGRIVASETLTALKKDVTGYLYGGDRSRKMKLWKKQKEGKKRLRVAGKVRIPPEVYLKVLKRA